MEQTGTITNKEIDERESRQIAWKIKQATWGDNNLTKISDHSERELGQEQLIYAAFREGMAALEKKANMGVNVPMSEFAKLMVWHKTEQKKLWEKQLEADKKAGFKIESRTWCGVPYHEFEIPSLHLYREGR